MINRFEKSWNRSINPFLKAEHSNMMIMLMMMMMLVSLLPLIVLMVITTKTRIT